MTVYSIFSTEQEEQVRSIHNTPQQQPWDLVLPPINLTWNTS